jgi:hypothetical protein
VLLSGGVGVIAGRAAFQIVILIGVVDANVRVMTAVPSERRWAREIGTVVTAIGFLDPERASGWHTGSQAPSVMR